MAFFSGYRAKLEKQAEARRTKELARLKTVAKIEKEKSAIATEREKIRKMKGSRPSRLKAITKAISSGAKGFRKGIREAGPGRDLFGSGVSTSQRDVFGSTTSRGLGFGPQPIKKKRTQKQIIIKL